MQLSQSDIIDAPCDVVYALVRDHLNEVAKFLPNVERIECQDRKELKNTTTIVNNWYAKVEIPSILKKIISEKFFSWKDSAVWDNKKMVVTYELESFFANDLFAASGKNVFEKIDNKTMKLTLNCSIEIYPEKIPGIPRLLVSTVKPTLEKLIERMLQPNLTSLGLGLKEYLKHQ